MEALRVNPNLAAAYESLGFLHWNPARNFEHEKALDFLYHAIQLNPSSVGALNHIGWVYNHTGFFDEAIAKAKESAALDPIVTNPIANLACSHLWKGVWEQSKGEYEQSLLLWPRVDREVLPSLCGSHWAWALFALGRRTEANAKLQEYLETTSDDDGPGELTAMKAVLLAAAGDEAGAIAQVKTAEKKTEISFGETHHATYFIACAYARLNKTAEALQWLKTTADTGFPVILYSEMTPPKRVSTPTPVSCLPPKAGNRLEETESGLGEV